MADRYEDLSPEIRRDIEADYPRQTREQGFNYNPSRPNEGESPEQWRDRGGVEAWMGGAGQSWIDMYERRDWRQGPGGYLEDSFEKEKGRPPKTAKELDEWYTGGATREDRSELGQASRAQRYIEDPSAENLRRFYESVTPNTPSGAMYLGGPRTTPYQSFLEQENIALTPPEPKGRVLSSQDQDNQWRQMNDDTRTGRFAAPLLRDPGGYLPDSGELDALFEKISKYSDSKRPAGPREETEGLMTIFDAIDEAHGYTPGPRESENVEDRRSVWGGETMSLYGRFREYMAKREKDSK